MVRGRLFEGLSMCDWAVFEGISAQVGLMVTETALRGAEYFLARGLGGEAEWMIRRALKISPYDERLYRALLRAAEGQGNRMGLRSAMAESCSPRPARPWGRARSHHVGAALVHLLCPSFIPKRWPSTGNWRIGGVPVARGDSSRL